MNVDEALSVLAQLADSVGSKPHARAIYILRANVERKVDDAMVERACRVYYNSGNPVYPPVFEAMKAALIAALGVEGD